jgi:hypothetical protein
MKRGEGFKKIELFLMKLNSFSIKSCNFFSNFTSFYTLMNFIRQRCFNFLNSVFTKKILKMNLTYFF